METKIKIVIGIGLLVLLCCCSGIVIAIIYLSIGKNDETETSSGTNEETKKETPTDPCGSDPSAKNLSDDCINKLWKDAGCTTSSWHIREGGDNLKWVKDKTKQELTYDFNNAWASSTDANRQIGCYGQHSLTKFVGRDIGGFDMPNMPIRNVEDDAKCHQLCKDNKDCMFSTWVDSKDCYLKKGTPTDGVVIVGAGFKYDKTDIGTSNLPGMPIKNIENADQCRMECLKNPACNLAGYATADKTCWLKQGNENPRTIYQIKQNI